MIDKIKSASGFFWKILGRRATRGASLLVGVLFFSQIACADTPSGFVRIQCVTALHRMQIDSFSVWDICQAGCPQAEDLAAEGIYLVQDFIQKHLHRPFECDLGTGKKVVMSILDHWSGKVIPGFNFDIKIDDRLVVPVGTIEGDTELNLEIQAYAQSAQYSNKIDRTALVTASDCYLSGKGMVLLPDSIHCDAMQSYSTNVVQSDRSEHAEYNKNKSP
jgi:hypothetical protein